MRATGFAVRVTWETLGIHKDERVRDGALTAAEATPVSPVARRTDVEQTYASAWIALDAVVWVVLALQTVTSTNAAVAETADDKVDC